MEMTKKLKKCTAAALSLCLAAMELPLMPVTAGAADPLEYPDFSFIGPVGSLTAEESAKAAEAAYYAIATHSSAVDFSKFGLDMTDENEDAFLDIYHYVVCCYDISIGALNSSVSYNPYSDTISLNYRFDKSEYEEKRAEYMAMLDDIVAPVKPSWSDEEKALYLHEYVASNFDYDYPALYGMVERPAYEQFSAYGMLVNGMAVCEGYANLYAMLMNKVGVPTKIVTSSEMKHAWNAVKIGDDWYFVDATWDDLYYGYKGFVKHDNFLTTAEELATSSSAHTSTDWLDSFGNPIYSATVPSTFSGAFWLDTEKPIQRYQNKWLALTGTGTDVQFTLYDYNGATHSASSSPLTDKLGDLAEWDVPDKPGYVWGDSYNVPVVVNDILYFSTPKAVYSYHNGKYIDLYDLTAAEKASNRIYGLYSSGGELRYGLDIKRRQRSDVLKTAVTHKSLDLAELEAKVIAEAGAATVKENTWISPLKISDWKEGETPSAPTAAAKYGEPEFTYYNASDDTPLAEAPTAAGNYYVIARVPATEEYEEIATEPVYFKVIPSAKAVTVTVPDTSVEYTQTPVFDVQVDGDADAALISSIKAAVTASAEYTGVGTYPIEASLDESAFPDCTFTYSLGTLTVTPKEPVLATENGESLITLTYSGEQAVVPVTMFVTDNDDPDLTMSFKWKRREEGGSYTELSEPPVHCGDYLIEATLNESENYTAQSIELAVKIEPLNITIEVEDAAITYGDKVPDKVKVKYIGLCEADNELFPAEVMASSDYILGMGVGTYSLSGMVSLNQDYKGTVKKGKLTVEKKPLTITAEACEITYGEKPPEKIRVVYDGLIKMDEATILDEFEALTEYKQYDPVGTYDLLAGVPFFANYDSELINTTLTVKPKSVKVFWGTVFSFTYDGTEKMISPSISGTVNNEQVAATVTGYKAVGAGSYKAKITELSNENYTVSDTSASIDWKIEKADLSVYPEDMTITYGDPVGEVKMCVEGLAEGDTISVIKGTPKAVTSYEQYKPVGDYELVYEEGLTAENYNIFCDYKGILSVVPKAIDVKWDETTEFAYDGTEKSVSAKLAGVIGGDDVRLKFSKNKASEVGEYKAEATVIGADAGNYKAEPVYFCDWKITQGKLEFTEPKAEKLTYSGSAQKLVSGASVIGGEISYSLDGVNYSSEIPTAVDAGKYTVYFLVKSDPQHSGSSSGSVPVTIAPFEITDKDSKLFMTAAHSGDMDSSPLLIAFYGTEKLGSGTDYTFTYDNAYKDGVGRAELTFIGNYTGTAAVEYTIPFATTTTTSITTTATTTTPTTTVTTTTTEPATTTTVTTTTTEPATTTTAATTTTELATTTIVTTTTTEPATTTIVTTTTTEPVTTTTVTTTATEPAATTTETTTATEPVVTTTTSAATTATTAAPVTTTSAATTTSATTSSTTETTTDTAPTGTTSTSTTETTATSTDSPASTTATTTTTATETTATTTTTSSTEQMTTETTTAEITTTTESTTTTVETTTTTESATTTAETTTTTESTTTTVETTTTTESTTTTAETTTTTESATTTAETTTTTTESTTTTAETTTTTESTTTTAETTTTTESTTTTAETTTTTESTTTTTESTTTIESTTASTETTTASTTETAPVTTETEPADKDGFGDPTGDGKVDAKDASKVLAMYAIYSTGGAPEEMTDELMAASDVNGDGQLDAKDASDILSFYAYISTGGKLSLRDYLSSKKTNTL